MSKHEADSRSYDKYGIVKNSRGFLGKITSKCVNPHCDKIQAHHTVQEAKYCLQVASADA